MLLSYPACFIKEKNGYSVIFPDLNYLATSGETLEEALNMAVDCLAGYLYWLEKDKEEIPSASTVNVINLEKIAEGIDYNKEESFVNLVSVDLKSYAKENFEKSVKKTLTIPAWLNKMALEKKLNFSKVLQEALKAELNL